MQADENMQQKCNAPVIFYIHPLIWIGCYNFDFLFIVEIIAIFMSIFGQNWQKMAIFGIYLYIKLTKLLKFKIVTPDHTPIWPLLQHNAE